MFITPFYDKNPDLENPKNNRLFILVDKNLLKPYNNFRILKGNNKIIEDTLGNTIELQNNNIISFFRSSGTSFKGSIQWLPIENLWLPYAGYYNHKQYHKQPNLEIEEHLTYGGTFTDFKKLLEILFRVDNIDTLFDWIKTRKENKDYDEKLFHTRNSNMALKSFVASTYGKGIGNFDEAVFSARLSIMEDQLDEIYPDIPAFQTVRRAALELPKLKYSEYVYFYRNVSSVNYPILYNIDKTPYFIQDHIFSQKYIFHDGEFNSFSNTINFSKELNLFIQQNKIKDAYNTLKYMINKQYKITNDKHINLIIIKAIDLIFIKLIIK
jgi:hypothetical protein